MTINIEEFKLLETLGSHLKIDEGICAGFYICPAGKLSCGVGHNVEARPITKRSMHKWLKYGMTTTDIDTLLVKDILSTKAAVENKYGGTIWYSSMSNMQKLGWLNMAYQMGVPRQAKFRNSISLMSQGVKGEKLYKELLDSEWFREDTPNRAARVSYMIAFDTTMDYYEITDPAIIKPTLIT